MAKTTQNAAPADAPDTLVIFGVTGDLARKMTFRALYRLEKAGRLKCPIIGVASDPWSQDQLGAAIRQALDHSGQVIDPKVLAKLTRRFSYLQGDITDAGTYAGWPPGCTALQGRCSIWRYHRSSSDGS